jgi:NRAMP (natural resistance-associated macrophage protein)-like metal ion transporter
MGGWRQLALAVGPGLVVMLADTEAGSVIAAAQGGAQWGYRLLLPQFALIPALFMAQELAARLGLATRRGLAELARHQLGRLPAALLLVTLVASCIGALVTELSGLAGVGELYGVPAWRTSMLAAAGVLGVIVLGVMRSGSYRVVELVAIAAGLCELAFVALAWLARPRGEEIMAQLLRMPLADRDYLYLLAANLGTCVIPWAVFYQQSASIDKGLTRASLPAVRIETLAGAVLCQTITAAIVVAAASAFGHGPTAALKAAVLNAAGRPLDRVGDIAAAFSAAVGPAAGRVVFALGLSGGAVVAAIITCLTAGWAFGEVFGQPRALGQGPAREGPAREGPAREGPAREGPARAPWCHGVLAAVLLASAVVVACGVNLVRISLAMGVLNAVLLPVVLAFVYHLARRLAPAELRLRGAYALAVAVVFVLTGGLGLYAALAGTL